MLQDPYLLDEAGRAVGWNLLAAHVRSNQYIPSWRPRLYPRESFRELNRLTSDGPERKRWARHGSTRWLWKDEDVRQALQYVIEEQGEPMALFVAEEL